MASKKSPVHYKCDVCGLRFKPEPNPEHPEFEEWCPRCHTPFVRPVTRRNSRRFGASHHALELPRYVGCG